MISDKVYVGNSYEQGYVRAKLYKPDIIDDTPCAFACVIINEQWNEKSLLDLKDKTGSVSLIGILNDSGQGDTNNTYLGALNTVDGVVKCQPDEVQAFVELLESKPSNGLLVLDAFDIKLLFEKEGIFEFAQVHPIKIESTREETLKIVVEKIIEKLSQPAYFSSILIDFNAQDVLIEDLGYICETIESTLSIDDPNLFYQATHANKPDYMGFRVIYSQSH
ncbi:hypothetical protein [Psychrobacter sanguinis]|uniref:hypothetical protein n=1 Tax=Psychrobacter sanguinis TaxID=861445 RepID=UPI001919A599|nr:hypothetical protein [Psychrobacter sanguinis]MCC3308261.1 hypothetical protein [Psychrobacter sanguinis]